MHWTSAWAFLRLSLVCHLQSEHCGGGQAGGGFHTKDWIFLLILLADSVYTSRIFHFSFLVIFPISSLFLPPQGPLLYICKIRDTVKNWIVSFKDLFLVSLVLYQESYAVFPDILLKCVFNPKSLLKGLQNAIVPKRVIQETSGGSCWWEWWECAHVL